MRRRAILAGISVAGAAAAAGAWPDWIAEAFASGSEKTDKTNGKACDLPDPSQSVKNLPAKLNIQTAAARARAAGRPLLVFVIPADDAQKTGRGQVFGEFLNHATDAQLAPLARAEIVCATLEDVKKLAPNVKGKVEPLMFQIDVAKPTASASAVDTVLPELEQGFSSAMSFEEQRRTNELRTTKRIALVAALIQKSLGQTPPQMVRAHANQVRDTIVKKPPTGTRWANSSGCGTDIEGEAPMMVGCGMGHVPEKSRRFLYFFSDQQHI